MKSTIVTAGKLPKGEKYMLPSLNGFTNDRSVVEEMFNNGHTIIVNGKAYIKQVVWVEGGKNERESTG